MTAGQLALVVAAVLFVVGFAALVLVLGRVLQTLREVRVVADTMAPLLAELRSSIDDARSDLDRFDRLLGSAEAISSSVEGASRVARVALSTPIIKTVALASGTGRAARKLRQREGQAS